MAWFPLIMEIEPESVGCKAEKLSINCAQLKSTPMRVKFADFAQSRLSPSHCLVLPVRSFSGSGS